MRWGRLLLATCLMGAAAIAQAECLRIPAPSGVVTSVYGWRFHPKFRYWRPHRGVDLRAGMRTELVATHAGVVQVSHSGGGGNEVRIVGTNGLVTRYLHLTKPLVAPGTRVSAGQPVALSGNTGHASTAAHLHLELYGTAGRDENPEPRLCPNPSRKPGADMSNGFPVTACNPVGGHCAKGSLPPSNGGQVPAPGQGDGRWATGYAGQEPMPPAPRMGEWDDMSLSELLGSEVMRRHGNPEWRSELAKRGLMPLLAEYAEMMALRAYVRFYLHESRERVESMLAAKMLRAQRHDMDVRLRRQRQAAAKAAGDQ